MSVIDTIRRRYKTETEPQRSERRLELVLVALTLLVALQVLWWFFAFMANVTVPPVAPAKDSMRVVDVNITSAITAPQSRALQSRPLFWASRRPNATAVPLPTATSGNQKPGRRLEDLQVAGALGAGDQGKAIVIYKDELMRLGIGDTVAGWSLQSVSLGEVVFVSAGARDVRRLTPAPVVAAPMNAPTAKTLGPAKAAEVAKNNNKKTEDKLSAGGH